MGDLPSTLVNYSPFVIITYLLIRDVFPRVWPDLFKLLSSKQSTEDRLFKLLEDSNLTNQNLSKSIDHLGTTLDKLEEKLEHIEVLLNDSTMKALHDWIRTLPQEEA